MEKQVKDGTTHLKQLIVQQELTRKHKNVQTGVSVSVMSVKNEQFVEKRKTFNSHKRKESHQSLKALNHPSLHCYRQACLKHGQLREDIGASCIRNPAVRPRINS